MSENDILDLSEYRYEVLSRKGTRILLRPIEKSDVSLWLKFFDRLSSHSKYLRWHNVPKEMSEKDALEYCTVDYKESFAYVAETGKGDNRRIIGITRYYRIPNTRKAEVAFAIEDEYQSIGLGTRLMEALVNVARTNDIAVFDATVLAENLRMMEVFRDYGFNITSRLEYGVYNVTFPIRRTRFVDSQEAARDRISVKASLEPIVAPKSVAIIGAARSRSTLGNLVMRCVLQSGYTGTVYPVNPNADSVLSIKAYDSVLDIPDPVDLGIIIVPASLVNRVADECGRKGVRAIIVISDGFREQSKEGAEREEELKSITLGYGMRLIGPNCMGVINTDPVISLNGTFSQVYPEAGNVAILSQSGAMGLTLLEHVKDLNIGISTFVSVGNRADVSSNDFLQYWENDPLTKVILLYLESFGNPRRFARLARRVAARKPIVAVKSGTTPAGAKAASSHTGALAASDVASDLLFAEAGIIWVNVVAELFNLATLLSTQPLPRGKKLVILTNGGGPGIIAADAASRVGLEVVDLSASTVSKIRPMLKRNININNPLDTTAGASAEEYEGTLKVLAQDENVDAVLAIFIPPIVVNNEEVMKAISRAAPSFWRKKKPLLACFIGQKGISTALGTPAHSVPVYTFPEDAVIALKRAYDYAELRRKPRGKIPRITGIKHAQARAVIDKAFARVKGAQVWLKATEIVQLLDCYGLDCAGVKFAATADDAAKFANETGFPVAIKLASPTITHKTDIGGVKLNIRSEDEARKAFTDIEKSLDRVGKRKEMDGVLIQQMASEGIEAIVGVTQDPIFGPLMLFGMGGTHAELLKDVILKLHPLTDLDAVEMINSLKMSALFDGYRGSPPADKEAIKDLLLRMSALIEDIPEIQELDLNPVKILPKGEGYRIVDARISIA